MTQPGQSYLVRLGPPAKGDTIHRSTCRYAQRPNALRWVWADKNPYSDWLTVAPRLKRCAVCKPPSPMRPRRSAADIPTERKVPA
jgi:hypothetical protein